MLANALIHVHLGRGWRIPQERPKLHPETPLDLAELEAYATHVRILSWFLDDPSPLCPFSVHRMALIGKELGKEVGQWFGPSTAAGALKTLANSFPICGLSVASAVDGTIYKSDVYAASNTTTEGWEPTSPRKPRPSSVHRSSWGNQPVLILVNLRLGLDNVNPIYYDSVKVSPPECGVANRLDIVHMAAVGRYRWRPTRLVLLLCRITREPLILPGPTLHSPSCVAPCSSIVRSLSRYRQSRLGVRPASRGGRGRAGRGGRVPRPQPGVGTICSIPWCR